MGLLKGYDSLNFHWYIILLWWWHEVETCIWRIIEDLGLNPVDHQIWEGAAKPNFRSNQSVFCDQTYVTFLICNKEIISNISEDTEMFMKDVKETTLSNLDWNLGEECWKMALIDYVPHGTNDLSRVVWPGWLQKKSIYFHVFK